jgi:hypothetical protein
MKRNFLLLLLFCLSFSNCYSQSKINFGSNQNKNEHGNSFDSLNKRISGITDKLKLFDSSFKIKLYTLTQAIDSTNKKINDSRLRESLKSAESTLNKQNSLIDGFGTLYTLITALIGLLAFMLPLMVYLFGILPARKQIRKSKKIIEEMDKNIDLKFDEYILKNKEKQINNALINIKGQDKFLRSTALNFLQYSINQGDLGDNQLHDIYILLTFKNDLDETSKLILSNILCCKKNMYSEQYFKDVVLNESPTLKHIGLHYFLFAGFEQYMENIANMILKSQNPGDEYIGLLLYLSSQAPKQIVTIINYNNLNENLSKEDEEKVKNELKDPKYDSLRTEINESFLFNVKN